MWKRKPRDSVVFAKYIKLRKLKSTEFPFTNKEITPSNITLSICQLRQSLVFLLLLALEPVFHQKHLFFKHLFIFGKKKSLIGTNNKDLYLIYINI